MTVDVYFLDDSKPKLFAHIEHVYDIEFKAADSKVPYSRYVLYSFTDRVYTSCEYRTDGMFLSVDA